MFLGSDLQQLSRVIHESYLTRRELLLEKKSHVILCFRVLIGSTLSTSNIPLNDLKCTEFKLHFVINEAFILHIRSSVNFDRETLDK